ncbi:hypothetical protein ATPR_1992 [Acetobacter tropicalis NBRC 101654]|uniref:Uncharacterized protein n=1 Tax=Acetobacter tropicalis NBRC 101654 TaxID=749388 RepID=F7VF43_9PROT|nr:hypothetical protein ATPR_1992 [Acetobacter tropicalis NBRC 101654]
MNLPRNAPLFSETVLKQEDLHPRKGIFVTPFFSKNINNK